MGRDVGVRAMLGERERYVERPVKTKSYVEFVEVPADPKRKTKVVRVDSRSHGDTLGFIRWHGPWRQYTFFPMPSTTWSRGCLDEVGSFIEGLMDARR